jgi:adhesin transport system membrane fusion protein
VRAIHTREGAIVEQGDPLVTIDNTGFGSSLDEQEERRATLTMRAARLEAELAGTALEAPADLVAERPELLAREQALLAARRAELAAALSVLDRQAEQRTHEIAEAGARHATLTRTVELAQRERAMIAPIVERGSAARADLLAVDSRLNDAQGGLEAVRLALPRLEVARREIAERREERLSAVRAEALTQLSETTALLGALNQSMRADRDRVARTEVRSPVRGVVKKLLVASIGQVVKPGADIVEIVPLEDTLVVEAQVRPQDVAQLHPGQKAMVKVTAYDPQIYGGLTGAVEHISADTITNERGESFYLIRVRTAETALERDGRRFPIIPGMVADVAVMTGERTVLDYILKPARRMRDEAMRER